MRRTAMLLGILLTLVGSYARAAERISPAKETDIRRLLEATGATRIGTVMTQSVVRQMGDAFRQSRPDLPAGLIDSMSQDVGKIFGEAMNVKGGLVDRMVPLYHRQFTHEEIKGMLVFYESPLGKKVAQALPVLTQESVELGQEWGESLGPQIEKAIAVRMKRAGLEP